MYYLSKQSYDKNKTIGQKNLMKLIVVAIVLAIVLGHPSNKSRLLIGSNRILFCFNNRSEITKRFQAAYHNFFTKVRS